MQLRQVALVSAKIREDAPAPAEVRGWAEAVRRLSPARDPAAFEDAKAAIAAGLQRLAGRLEARV